MYRNWTIVNLNFISIVGTSGEELSSKTVRIVSKYQTDPS